jgi:hypothetical protein
MMKLDKSDVESDRKCVEKDVENRVITKMGVADRSGRQWPVGTLVTSPEEAIRTVNSNIWANEGALFVFFHSLR